MGKRIHADSTRSYDEQKLSGSTESFRRAIFQLLAQSKDPMTDRQLMAALNEDDVNNVRPEVTRLKDDGLITEVDKVTCQWTGKTVRRSTVTGRPYFARNNAPPSPKQVELIEDKDGQYRFI